MKEEIGNIEDRLHPPLIFASGCPLTGNSTDEALWFQTDGMLFERLEFKLIWYGKKSIVSEISDLRKKLKWPV